MSRENWVYVRTGTVEPTSRESRPEQPSVRAEVIEHKTTYTVRMPDGELREVTDDDLVFDRREADPVTTNDVTGYGKDGTVEDTHPSFGQIGIYHTSGGGRAIYGSKLESHQHSVSIKLCLSSVEHNLATDWYHGGRTIAEVSLSPARFAEFIATPNRGDGIPCSITYLTPRPGPGMIPRATFKKTEAGRIVDRIKELGSEVTAKQAGARSDIEELLAKVPKSRRDAVLAAFDKGARVINDTAPFLVGCATEALEHRVSEGKAEVEAFVSTALRSAGVEAINADPSKLFEHAPGGRKALGVDDEEGAGDE